MTKPHTSSRREFVTRGAQTAAVLGLTGSLARASTADRLRTSVPTRSFPTGIRQVRGIAVGLNDEILVAGDRCLKAFTPAGEALRTLDLEQEPSCVAVRPDARILVGFPDHIEVFVTNGQREEVWPRLGADTALASLAVAGPDEVFVSDGGQRVIWHLDGHGAVLGRLDRGGAPFAVPRDFFPIAWSNGHLVVANLGRHSIETLAPDGQRLSQWGGRARGLEGFGGCCNPIALAVTPCGEIITGEGGLPRVKRFDAHGQFQELLAGPDELEANARGSHEITPTLSQGCHAGGLELAVDSKGRVLVLDRVTAEVRVVATA